MTKKIITIKTSDIDFDKYHTSQGFDVFLDLLRQLKTSKHVSEFLAATTLWPSFPKKIFEDPGLHPYLTDAYFEFFDATSSEDCSTVLGNTARVRQMADAGFPFFTINGQHYIDCGDFLI